MLKALATLPRHPGAWKLLFVTALGLEVCALYFQYVMELQPCIMCVYQRTAVMGIAIAALLGIFTTSFALLRIISLLAWIVASVWGALIAWEHVQIQQDPFGFMMGCEIVPNYPSWAPLHQWLPEVFAATGDCGTIDWQFLGWSMPQWMMVIFAAYAVVSATILVLHLFVKARD